MSAADPDTVVRGTRLRASVIVVGDEILGGFVQDTNSGWIAGRLRIAGVPLDRVVTVPDEAAAIDEALQTELRRDRPRVVLTSGGIGSTPDDLTLEAVAVSLGTVLRTEPSIDARITHALERSAAQGAVVTAEHERAIRKMAQVPREAYLLPGATGVAPGVAIDLDGGAGADDGATIVILPGVPGELRRIVTQGVEPALLAGRGRPQHIVEITHDYPESALSPALEWLVVAFPDVQIGSYPGTHCLVRLRGARERVELAAEAVRGAVAELGGDAGAADLRARWQRQWSG
jgi:nicotinamide-nucleotide amidase